MATTGTLPRTGPPSKTDETTRRELVQEAAKRPTATLKELQGFITRTGCGLHVTTICCILHMSGLWGRVARQKKNIQEPKTSIQSAKSLWDNVFWSEETKVELFVHNSKKCVCHRNNTASSAKSSRATVKHGGGSIMLWACWSSAELGHL